MKPNFAQKTFRFAMSMFVSIVYNVARNSQMLFYNYFGGMLVLMI
jgi:hypothetical protein